MALSFFLYDLETSGVNPRESRIMQFAGQRTDMDLRPIGEPVNVLIRLTEDILPDPDAIFLTGITPQMTIADGIREAEFLRQFTDEVATPGTIFVGYNSVRFDDEFMRFLHYRNFYDPYEWQWKENRSRWDLLDVVRMMRALRPEGVNWPVDAYGKPTNRLELLTAHNKLDHANAHDALSDVNACISLARLIREKQPKLFDYLLQMRDKNKVAELVNSGQPFVYTAGSYPSEYDKTTIVTLVSEGSYKQGVLVYDLRHDPLVYKDMDAKQLAELWKYKKDSTEEKLPVKVLAFNRCPAVAPLGVLGKTAQEHLHLDLDVIEQHRKSLSGMQDFPEKLREAQHLMEKAQQLSAFQDDELTVDSKLYDGFFNDHDRQLLPVVRAAAPEELDSLSLSFEDDRLTTLLPLYAARNYPKTLSDEERSNWEAFCHHRLTDGGQHSRLARYISHLQAVSTKGHLSTKKQYLLEELRLYGESLIPIDEGI